MSYGFDRFTDKQRAVVSALQRVISELNTEIARAAEADLDISIDVITVPMVGYKVPPRRVTAKVLQEDIPIA